MRDCLDGCREIRAMLHTISEQEPTSNVSVTEAEPIRCGAYQC